MPYDSRTADLARRAAEGDAVALTLYLKETRAALRERLALRIPREARPAIDADDLVQETHVAVFRGIAGFRPRGPGALDRWIATIAVHKLRDARKHQRAARRGGGRARIDLHGVGPTESTVMLLEGLAHDTHTPSRSVARREAETRIQEALARLPHDQREALTLVYLRGMTAAAAAERMKRTERGIHGLCRRGLKALRDAIVATCDFRSWLG